MCDANGKQRFHCNIFRHHYFIVLIIACVLGWVRVLSPVRKHFHIHVHIPNFQELIPKSKDWTRCVNVCVSCLTKTVRGSCAFPRQQVIACSVCNNHQSRPSEWSPPCICNVNTEWVCVSLLFISCTCHFHIHWPLVTSARLSEVQVKVSRLTEASVATTSQRWVPLEKY